MERAFHFNKNYQGRMHFDNRYLDNPRVYDDMELYQIGDLFCESGRMIERHEQICYEITLVIAGKGVFNINGKAYEVREGDIFLNVPGQIHEGRADLSEPYRYFYLGFGFCGTGEKENTMANIQKTFDKIPYPITRDMIGITDLFVKFFSEMMEYNDYSTEMVKMFMRQIIILTYRNFTGNFSAGYLPENERDEGNQIVYKVINYLEKNIEGINNLPLIAEKLGYSYYYISHLFTNKTGKSLQEYYNELRFEKAKSFILDDQLSFTQIAEKLNYGSIHSFSRAFKRMSGLSPSEFKKLGEEKG